MVGVHLHCCRNHYLQLIVKEYNVNTIGLHLSKRVKWYKRLMKTFFFCIFHFFMLLLLETIYTLYHSTILLCESVYVISRNCYCSLVSCAFI